MAAAREIGQVVLDATFDLTTPTIVDEKQGDGGGGIRLLIRDAHIQLLAGHRYGLVGKNGSGKSCLMRHIATQASSSSSSQSRSLRIVSIGQTQSEQLAQDQSTPLDYVLTHDEVKCALDAEEERLMVKLEAFDDDDAVAAATTESLLEVQTRLEAFDPSRMKKRAIEVLRGLGFSDEMMCTTPCARLSGGWRQRLVLACGLFVCCDVLLVDEPSNHLDVIALEWLAKHLMASEFYSRTAIVMVSHDRNLLDTIATDILELADQRLTPWAKHNFTSFAAAKQQQEVLLERRLAQQLDEEAALRIWINEGRKSKNPDVLGKIASKQRHLDELEEAIVATRAAIGAAGRRLRIAFPTPRDKLDHDLLTLNDASFAWPGAANPLLSHISVHMERDKPRIGLVALNGQGKTTLLNLICGTLQPTSGVCRLNPKARWALFTQHHLEQLPTQDSSSTPTTLAFLQARFPECREHEIRGKMGRVQFDAALLSQPLGTLSGGQQSRVAFALLTWNEPHLLVFDEVS